MKIAASFLGVVAALALAYATLPGCSYAKTGCKVIHATDKACHLLVLQDGTPVEITPEDLEILGRTALARKAADAGADHEAGVQ
jgi:hypothetical protein